MAEANVFPCLLSNCITNKAVALAGTMGSEGSLTLGQAVLRQTLFLF